MPPSLPMQERFFSSPVIPLGADNTQISTTTQFLIDAAMANSSIAHTTR